MDVLQLTGALVAWGRSADVLAACPGAERWLGAPETDRRSRLRSARDRDDFLGAHVLVRVVAGRWSDTAPANVTIEQHCPGCDSAGHGRPALPGRPGLGLSLSHSAGWVAAAVADGSCGVDIESLASLPAGSLPTSVFAPAEQDLVRRRGVPAFAQLWVRKEAAVKAGAFGWPAAAGHGLTSHRPSGGCPARCCTDLGPADSAGSLNGWQWHDLPVADEVRAALVVRADTAPGSDPADRKSPHDKGLTW